MHKTFKIILIFILVLFKFHNHIVVNATSSSISIPQFEYNTNNIDWEQIEYIQVLYLKDSIEYDPFLKDAKEKNIPIIIDSLENIKSNVNFIEPYNSPYSHFSSISWISREDGVSVSVMPRSPFAIEKEPAWREIYQSIQFHPQYTAINNNTKLISTYNQFICHADYARGFKTPWNLEPWKPDKGYKGFVDCLCN